jgi:hypothetical protein
MKSLEKFVSSDSLKNLDQIIGGKGPVYLGWSATLDDKGNETDDELITQKGTGDCDSFWSGGNNCIDETYNCR